MSEKKHRLNVFLCHASIDKPRVRELYQYLKQRRIRPWLDEVELVPGQDWDLEIYKALENSDAIIILLSKSSINKEGYIQKEIRLSLNRALNIPQGRIFLIPARLEECKVPDNLSRIQWVDLFDKNGYKKLMRALKTRMEQVEYASIISAQPTEQDRELPSKTENAQKDIIGKQDLETIRGDIRSLRGYAGKYQE